MPNLYRKTADFGGGSHPDISEIFYVVDTNFRTAAQGWTQSDHTGPLDLYGEKNPGRVYYGAGSGSYSPSNAYATDAAAIQAANDAMVDARGDVLFFTPGSYSIGTALTLDVIDGRYIGPKVAYPTLARATLTMATAAADPMPFSAQRQELGFLQLVPETAQRTGTIADGNSFHGHDLFFNWDGIVASTSTVGFALSATANFVCFERLYIWVDAAQGPIIRGLGAYKGLTIRDFEIYVEAGTWAVAFNFAGVGVSSYHVGPGVITGTGGAALTSLITQADKTQNTTHGMVHNVRASTVGPAAGSLAVATGAAAEIDIVDCWLAVATDTAQPTFTSGNAISWESGVPYTG